VIRQKLISESNKKLGSGCQILFIDIININIIIVGSSSNKATTQEQGTDVEGKRREVGVPDPLAAVDTKPRGNI